MSSPDYLAPEQVRGMPYSRPSDLWALGVVLYELLTLQRPFRAENVAALVAKIQEGRIDEGPTLQSGHAPELAALASPRHLLQSDPEARMTSRDLPVISP